MRKRSQGFTLIEILIVIALMAVLTGIGADLFVNSLKAYQKSQITNQLSQNGNFVMSTILNAARNAKAISVSSDEGYDNNTLKITDASGVTTTFRFLDLASGAGYISRKVGEEGWKIITSNNATSGIDIDTSVSRFDLSADTPRTLTVVLKISQAPNTPINRAYNTTITLTNSVIIRGEYL